MIDEKDKGIIEMLAKGHNYNEISNSLNIANRTIEQRVSFLKDIFNASTLFQLGVNIKQEGLI
jgi:DNA-binding NarL/FixJ family response regulator